MALFFTDFADFLAQGFLVLELFVFVGRTWQQIWRR
jgi:hypothetical protein